jgi:signal transduction histidine kinase
LEEFAGIVSHDLRNPLQVALSRLQLLREEGETDENVEAIDDAVRRMDELVDDLFAVARQGGAAVDSEPVVLSSVAQQAWDSIDAADATLDIEATASIYADAGRVRQLFENLFRNALQHGTDRDLLGTDSDADPNPFTDDEPVLTVRVGDLPDGFYVADDGDGVPADERTDIFDVGYTTSEAGTGLGLDIVADIADAHDWDITITDGPAGGARFEITGVETF